MGVALGLTAALGVGGTLAILSQQSNTVTNTFAVGNGINAEDIKLDETDITAENFDGQVSDSKRTEEGNNYENIEPASHLVKDPQVHITADAADSYVFVNITGLDEYLAEIGEENQAVTDFGANGVWKKYESEETEETSLNGVYYYAGDSNEKKGIVAKENEGSKVSVGEIAFDSEKLFAGIDLSADADLYYSEGDEIPKGSKVGDPKTNLPEIKIQALAVQATSGDDAWDNACDVVDGFGWPTELESSVE